MKLQSFCFQSPHVQLNKDLKSIKHCINEKIGIRRVGKIKLNIENKQKVIFLPSSCWYLVEETTTCSNNPVQTELCKVVQRKLKPFEGGTDMGTWESLLNVDHSVEAPRSSTKWECVTDPGRNFHQVPARWRFRFHFRKATMRDVQRLWWEEVGDQTVEMWHDLSFCNFFCPYRKYINIYSLSRMCHTAMTLSRIQKMMPNSSCISPWQCFTLQWVYLTGSQVSLSLLATGTFSFYCDFLNQGPATFFWKRRDGKYFKFHMSNILYHSYSALLL